MNVSLMSDHQRRVALLHVGIGQTIPSVPTIPPYLTRELRARLILEEALETINALGVQVAQTIEAEGDWLSIEGLTFCEGDEPDLLEIADGCADMSVVLQGTLLSCGVPDRPVFDAVDANNLLKIGSGTINEHGKFVKSPTHPKVDLQSVLERL